ncbi:MAG: HlyD family efflux transporter periplasmic adaptor subunit [Magnetococcales bacterium]|nr:HlyD family efflux transporter periplasmic adaptor subunit [Magnetococcales bacterium]MBF0156392.1 HlyD family efflux transporter periplasmic adaptor subunit [Magnetococcales bacterium]
MESSLSTQLGALVREITVRAGEAFDKNDVLIRFDCRVQEAALKKVQAELKGSRKNLEVKRQLVGMNALSTLEMELADAEVSKMEAEVASASAVASFCELRAPFAGKVVEWKIRPHESSTPGQSLLDVVASGELEVELMVSSRWLNWLKPGISFSMNIAEMSRDYPAVVTKLGAKVDAVSQTVKVYGRLVGHHPDLMPGMSGEASFADRPQ